MTAPSKFAHVVYNTHRYDEMIQWYAKVFGARIQHRDDRLTFMTYDDEHHRFAFANLGPLPADAPPPRMGRGVGVNHVAYTWRDLGELVDLYARLKADGILPAAPVRHGLTLSLYYADPDGNMMEFQIDVLEPGAANEFMAGPSFAANPIGERFDPDELVVRYRAGRPVEDLVLRSDQAPMHVASGRG